MVPDRWSNNFSFYVDAGFIQDPDIIHVEGDVDPIRDLDIINEELRLKDIEFFEKIYDDCEKKIKKNANDKKLKEESVILTKIKKVLMEDKKQLRYHLDPPRQFYHQEHQVR